MATQQKYHKDLDRVYQFDTLEEWGNYFDVMWWTFPFEFCQSNSLEIIKSTKEYIENTNDYQATVMLNDIDTNAHIVAKYRNGLMELFLLRKVKGLRKNKLMNPNYAHVGHHEENITDTDERLEFFNSFCLSPMFSMKWVAKNWGVTRTAAYSFLNYHGVSLTDVRERRRRIWGRTFYLISRWYNYSYEEVIECFPIDEKKALNCIYEHGENADDDWPKKPPHPKWVKRQSRK